MQLRRPAGDYAQIRQKEGPSTALHRNFRKLGTLLM